MKTDLLLAGKQAAIDAAGGVVALSLKLGLSRGAASQWSCIPSKHVVHVEEITGVPREVLRPDLYVRASA